MKVLFIGPVFYDYHVIIKQKIESLTGALVSFFPEKKDGLLFGVLNTISPKLIFLYQKIYFWMLWQKIKNENFTHFFLIRGYKIPISFLIKVRKQNPWAKFIMYQWDSNKNNNYFHLIDYFDVASTFDFYDSQCDNRLEFRQLFFTDDINKIKGQNKLKKYDLFCFSSFTVERYNSLLKFVSFCNDNNILFKTFCYIPRSTYIRLKYFKGFKLEKKYLSFKSMPRAEYLGFLEESDIIVDFSHETQTGLSMKVIEAYGAGRKIWTTNKAIINNPIYSPIWVQIFDVNNIKMPLFPLEEIDLATESLFIDNWIRDLINSK